MKNMENKTIEKLLAEHEEMKAMLEEMVNGTPSFIEARKLLTKINQ